MKFGKSIVLVVPLILVLWASSASAATGCAGAPAASAINQYCEMFPSSAGPHSPKSGTPSLGTTLPPRLVHQLSGSGAAGSAAGGAATSSRTTASAKGGHGATSAARRGLLTLPAASIHRTRAPLRAASTSAWSLYSSLFVGLAVLTLALAVATVAIARRRQSSDN